MYVKKFEGDSLDETLKLVKRELGPDAIILKTISNKGIKGAFKKARIEITAAISEESYAKKARVDRVFTDEQADKFYQKPSSSINQMINQYNESGKKQNAGYGNIALNKSVNMNRAANRNMERNERASTSSLDDFLSQSTPQVVEEKVETKSNTYIPEFDEEDFEEIEHAQPQIRAINVDALDLKQQLKSQQNKIDILEKKLFELTQNITINQQASRENEDNQAIKLLHQNLRMLDLNEQIINNLIKKAVFEIARDELEDEEILYEFVLRELNSRIHTAMPMFSSVDENEGPFVTVLMNEGAAGQTSMAYKVAALRSNTSIVCFTSNKEIPTNYELVKSLYNLEVNLAHNVAEVINHTRKATAAGKSVIIDLKFDNKDLDDSKKTLESIKRSFNNLEFLLTISAINSEIYNRKILSKYKEFSNGVIISNVDQCMSFGALLNVHLAFDNIPLKFFGTGPVIPEDIEAATSERILASMFQL